MWQYLIGCCKKCVLQIVRILRFSQNRIVKRCAWFLLFYFILDISDGGGGNNLRQSYFEFSLNIVRIEISFKPQWKDIF
jgi:hypothetical protein